MSLIDAHQHFWQYDPVEFDWIEGHMARLRRDFLPPELEALYEAQGVAGCVAVQARQTTEETDWLLELAAAHPFIKAVAGWVHLLAEDLPAQLDHWQGQTRLKGFRHIAQAEPNDFLARPEVISGVQALGKAGYVYDILIFPPQFEAALTLVRACSDQLFVLDHLAKPYIKTGEIDAWAQNLKELAAYPQVSCKLSGMVTEADWENWSADQLRPYLEVALEAFGPERLMFGSDWPVCLLAASYEKVKGVIEDFVGQLSADEQAAIWSGTARRVYGIGEG
jgi:L-fuconolactonase